MPYLRPPHKRLPPRRLRLQRDRQASLWRSSISRIKASPRALPFCTSRIGSMPAASRARCASPPPRATHCCRIATCFRMRSSRYTSSTASPWPSPRRQGWPIPGPPLPMRLSFPSNPYGGRLPQAQASISPRSSPCDRPARQSSSASWSAPGSRPRAWWSAPKSCLCWPRLHRRLVPRVPSPSWRSTKNKRNRPLPPSVIWMQSSG